MLIFKQEHTVPLRMLKQQWQSIKNLHEIGKNQCKNPWKDIYRKIDLIEFKKKKNELLIEILFSFFLLNKKKVICLFFKLLFVLICVDKKKPYKIVKNV